MKNISRVLIANRGEIAVRVIRACRELGIESVAAVSEADRDSLPAKMANRTVCIGPPPSTQSYLNIDALMMAALGTGCQAIHPGYGFLAEQPELPESCERNGLIFIGPTPDNIRQMGDKLMARKIVQDCGIPIIPGSEMVRDLKEAMAAADTVGYPIMIKAAAGGGGRGMKVIHNAEEMKSAFEVASAEAHAAFKDDRLYLEHYIWNARHIEVQVLGDQFGNVIHLGERDCSLQRRNQKILEESPCPVISAKQRKEICTAALAIANRIKYESAGTVEFLFDMDRGQFYFLEMNTRIQVEHPVTEMVMGVDLVKEQMRIAGQNPLRLTQSNIKAKGHALECRINAESPDAGFNPCPGRIECWVPPQGPGIRVDSHCYSGYFVSPYYDSLLAKIITVGVDRSNAMERMRFALANFFVSGIDTTIPFHQFLLSEPDFQDGKMNTRWIESILANPRE